MSGLHPMASMETRAPLSSMRSRSAGMAVISLDFSTTASCPSTSRLVVAKARPDAGPFERSGDHDCGAKSSRRWRPDRACRPHRRPTPKNMREQGRIDPVHDRTQPIGAWNAVGEFREAPQKRQVGFAPIDDLFVIVAARDRPAHDQEQHLAQWIGDLPRLPRIPDPPQMIEHKRNRGLAEKASIGPSRILRWAPENHPNQSSERT